VFLQESPGQFPTSPSLAFELGSEGVLHVAAADLNGDGLLDLIAALATDSIVAVFFQTEPGRFPSTPSLILDESARQVTTADLNSDGQFDIAVAGGDHLSLYFAK